MLLTQSAWMRTTVLLAAVVCYMTASATADDVNWRTTYGKAAREAALTGKPMLMQITAPWCTYCVKMNVETFTDPQTAKHVNGCFIPFKIDADLHAELVEAIGIESLPTTVIIAPDFKILKRIKGYQNPVSYDRTLETICRDHMLTSDELNDSAASAM